MLSEHPRSSPPLIFVVGEDPAAAQKIVLWLACEGYRCEAFLDPSTLPERLHKQRPDAICLELTSTGQPPAVWRLDGTPPVILITDTQLLERAAEATAHGAYHWHPKPLKRERLLITVRNAVAHQALRRRCEHLASKNAPNSGASSIPRPEPDDLDDETDAAILPMEEVERRTILRAIQVTRGNISRAARQLRLGRATLYRKLSQYGIDIKER